jgi:hypothetical protein
MEWKTTWNDPLTSYVGSFDGLIGDKRTRKTLVVLRHPLILPPVHA